MGQSSSSSPSPADETTLPAATATALSNETQLRRLEQVRLARQANMRDFRRDIPRQVRNAAQHGKQRVEVQNRSGGPLDEPEAFAAVVAFAKTNGYTWRRFAADRTMTVRHGPGGGMGSGFASGDSIVLYWGDAAVAAVTPNGEPVDCTRRG